MKIVCLIKTIFISIFYGKVISGHDFLEMYSNEDIQVLFCKKCGFISISWFKSDLCDMWNDFLERETK